MAQHVCCVAPSLSMGGLERNIVRLAGWLTQAGLQVTLLTLNPDAPDFYAVPAGVRRVKADPAAFASPRWYDIPAQLRRNNALRRSLLALCPNAVIAFGDTTNIAVCLALWRSRVPVAVSVRTYPNDPALGVRWRLLRRLAYPRAQRVVMVSEDSREWAVRRVLRWNIEVIPNPVMEVRRSGRVHNGSGVGRTIAGLGRLVYAKGFDTLIAAFARLATRFPDWQLCIHGEGPERPRLTRQAAEHGLTERVRFPGATQDVEGTLSEADLFVFPSRFEGFPNALAEAMACGLASIAFDSPGAVRELIRHGIDGLLVPLDDVGALAEAMARLMADDVERERMAARAR